MMLLKVRKLNKRKRSQHTGGENGMKGKCYNVYQIELAININNKIGFFVDFFLCSFHPYLFFNQDNISFTFFGFNVTENGDAVDPATSKVIEPKIMSSELRTALMDVDKNVNLLEDYRKWNRYVQLTL